MSGSPALGKECGLNRSGFCSLRVVSQSFFLHEFWFPVLGFFLAIAKEDIRNVPVLVAEQLSKTAASPVEG